MATSEGNESSLLRDLTGLQDSESLAVFREVSFDAVVAFDPEERITSWNPAAEQMFGWTSQEALGEKPADLFWPMDSPIKQEDKRKRQARLKRGEILRGELIPRRKDGSSFPAQFTAHAIFDEDGKISGYLAVYRDISAQLQAREKEEQLQRSNQRLNEILASIQDDFYVLNRDWVFVFVSRTFTARIGKEPEDFVGNNIWEMFPKHVGGILYQNFHIAMEKREVRRFEIPGSYTNAWYRMTAFPSTEGITVLGTDISERRRMEDALRESEERYRRIVESTHEGIWILDLDGKTTHVNEQMAGLLGYTAQEMIGRSAFDFVSAEDSKRGQEEWSNRRNEISGRQSVFGYRHKAGHTVWCLVNSSAIVDEQGNNLGILGMFSDITERIRSEQVLRQQAQLLNLSGEAIFVWGFNGAIEYWNHGAEKLYGYSSSEAIGQVSHELLATQHPQSVTAFMTTLETSGEWRGEVVHQTRDGRKVIVESSQQLVHQGGRKLVLETNRDVTERKRAEEALRESEKQLQQLNESLEQKVQEKTEEVRRLASDLTKAVQRERHRISHILHDDLQQRIYAIQMQLAFLRYELEAQNETAQNEISEVEKQLAEVLEITRHLSIDLSPPILQHEGLAHAISWLAGQMRQRYGMPIELESEEDFVLPDEDLHVLLFNCVRELLFNAVKHSGASRAVVALHRLDTGLEIQVRDDGRGFPANSSEGQENGKMNGKEENVQSSFGLPTIRHQLSLFGGRMEIQSGPGAGTRIILFAPITQDW